MRVLSFTWQKTCIQSPWRYSWNSIMCALKQTQQSYESYLLLLHRLLSKDDQVPAGRMILPSMTSRSSPTPAQLLPPVTLKVACVPTPTWKAQTSLIGWEALAAPLRLSPVLLWTIPPILFKVSFCVLATIHLFYWWFVLKYWSGFGGRGCFLLFLLVGWVGHGFTCLLLGGVGGGVFPLGEDGQVFFGGGWGGYLFVSLWEGICLFLFRFDDQGFCSSCKYLKSEWVSADYWYLTTKHDKHGQGSCLCVCVFRSLHVHREQQQQSGRQGSTAERNPEPYHWQLPCLLLQHEWSRQEDLPFLYVSQWGIICVLSGLPCTSLSLLRCWPDCALCCRFDASILAATASAKTKHCSACDGSLYLLFTLWCKV